MVARREKYWKLQWPLWSFVAFGLIKRGLRFPYGQPLGRRAEVAPVGRRWKKRKPHRQERDVTPSVLLSNFFFSRFFTLSLTLFVFHAPSPLLFHQLSNFLFGTFFFSASFHSPRARTSRVVDLTDVCQPTWDSVGAPASLFFLSLSSHFSRCGGVIRVKKLKTNEGEEK